MKKTILSLLSLGAIITMNSCGDGPEQSANNYAQDERATAAETEETSATYSNMVCVTDNTPLREDGNKNGKWKGSLSLGETIKFTGESKIDADDNDREYFQVELSDGSVYWAPDYGLVKDASSAITIKAAPLYKRPDPLTISKNKLEMMEMVAITQTKGEWIEVVGERKSHKKKGWIKADDITKNSEDIAVAILATKALRAEEGTEIEKLEKIIEESPYQDNYFIVELQRQLVELKATADLDSKVESVIDSAITE